MKVDQKNETNPNTPSVYLSHAHSYANMEPFPPVHLSDRCLKPGKYSQIFSRSISNVQHWVRSLPALHIAMACIVLHLFASYLLFLPPLLSGRPRDYRRRSRVRLHPWRPNLFSRASRQANPLEHAYITHSFSLMLALELLQLLFRNTYSAA